MPHEFSDSKTEMEEILRQETIGWLGLSGDGGPYVVPLNYAYVDGRILFHCAHEGLKLDCIRATPEACFAVGQPVGRRPPACRRGSLPRGQRQRALLRPHPDSRRHRRAHCRPGYLPACL